MSASIKSIFECKTFLVNLEDDRDGDQVAIVAHVPFINRAVVVSLAKAADLKAGQGTIKGLAGSLEAEFIARVTGKKEEAPAKKGKGKG